MLHALAPYWSYILAPFGLAGMWIAGRNHWGWLLSIFTQILWLTYAVATKQYGFMIGSTAYLFVYLRNFFIGKTKSKESDSERTAEYPVPADQVLAGD
jgi:hypothetical protein